jgi:hypothetical protein
MVVVAAHTLEVARIAAARIDLTAREDDRVAS